MPQARVLEGAEAQLARYLRRRRLKFTPERRLILREVFEHHDHFEADALLVRLRGRGIAVSKATLYRTLALLVRAGLLRQELFGERHSHYEHILGHAQHDHFVCLRCGKVAEFSNKDIERLQEDICRRHAFRPQFHRMAIYGYCSECRDEEA